MAFVKDFITSLALSDVPGSRVYKWSGKFATAPIFSGVILEDLVFSCQRVDTLVMKKNNILL